MTASRCALSLFLCGAFCSIMTLQAIPGDEFEGRRLEMVATQIEARGVKDPRVLSAMRRIPRHLFVSPDMARFAYDDNPLPIGYGQTISQPYIVALMTELCHLEPDAKVLEIGTGSGYQTAVLAELANHVYTIDIVEELATSARERLKQSGYRNVEVMYGDGYRGWPQAAPFDAIIVTAAPPEIPRELIRQLKPGGRCVVPVGEVTQNLMVITKDADGTIHQETDIPVRFVPMVRKGRENKP